MLMATLTLSQSNHAAVVNGAMAQDRYSILDGQVRTRLLSIFEAGLCPAVSIDDRAIGHLAELSPQQAIEVLDKFEVGLSKGDVRNPSAFLSSGIRRQSQPRGPSLHELAPQAQQVLEQLYESGPVKRTDLDAKCMRLLANHPPEFQVLALDTFAERNLLGVRNVAAFFTTHLLKLEEQVRAGKVQLPPIHPPGSHLPHDQGFLQQQQQQGILQQQQQQGLLLQQLHLLQQQQQQQQLQQFLVAGAAATSTGLTLPGGLATVAGLQQQAGGSNAMLPAAQGAAAGAPKHFGVEQAEWGVRVDEFHGLSPVAKYVHPAAALKLQELWDGGNKLVSLLDDSSWDALASLDAAHALRAVNDTAKAMALVPDDIPTVNAVFIKVASQFPRRPNAPPAMAAAASPQPLPAGLQLGGPGAVALPQQAQHTQQQQQSVAGQVPGGLLGMAGVMLLGSQAQQTQQAQQGGAMGLLQMPLSIGGMAGGGTLGLGPVSQSLAASSAGMLSLPGPAQPVQLAGSVQQQQGAAGAGGGGGLPQLGDAARTLPLSLQLRIAGIIGGSGGLVRAEHFDAKIVNFMQNVGEYDTLRVLEELSRNDFGSIRNVPAFIMGILKKHADAAAGRGAERGGRGGGQHGRGEEGHRAGRPFGRRYEPY